MAIGTAAAIGLGAVGVGSVLGASSANKASKRAAQTSAENNTQNNALAREIYGQNRQIMTPFLNRGNAAGDQINALLGLGGSPINSNSMGSATMMPNALSQFAPTSPVQDAQRGALSLFGMSAGLNPSGAGAPYGIGDTVTSPYGGGMAGMDSNGFGTAYLSANPDVAAEFQRVGANFNNDPNAFAQFHYENFGQAEGRPLPGVTQTTQAAPAMTAREAADQGFELFKRSSGYQNRLNSALDSVTGAYSGIGTFQSGAAAKALQDRAGQVAGDEFANYMNALGSQQAIGAGSASALAGVGQNYAGTVMSNNNFNAQNQMSAQLAQQNPLANALGTIGGFGLSFLGGGK